MAQYLSTLDEYKDPTSHSSPLPSLYSSLSSLRKSNPAAYRTNIEWWARRLTEAVAYGTRGKGKQREIEGAERLVLTVDEELLDSWTVEDVGRPMGIATVVGEMAAARQLIPLREYLSASAPYAAPGSSTSRLPSARSVAAFVVGKPLWWALGQLGIGGADGDDDEDEQREWRKVKGQWVVWDRVESTADAVLSEHYNTSGLSPLDSLYTQESFKSLVARVAPKLTSQDIRIILKHLSRDLNSARIEGNLIKLSPTPHESITSITSSDRNLLAVRETHNKLNTQITDLESRLTTLTDQTTLALRNKQRTKALTLLKQKKSLQELLDRRLGSKATLDEVLLKIEQAAGDVEIMKSYEMSNEVLRGLLGRDELQMDRVEKTVEALQDSLADQREIDGVLRGVNTGEDEVDEEELLREMRELEEQERRERREREERQRKEQERSEREEKERKEREDKERKETERKEKEQRERERKEAERKDSQPTPDKEAVAVDE